MASSTGKKSLPLGWMAAGTLFSLGIGGLSFAVASSHGGEDIARVERVRANLSQELAEARRETEAARSEIARLDRVRADQFGDLVAARRELASVRADIQAQSAARTTAQSAEIARLDRVRQTLFEELVGTRRELISARTELQAASRPPSGADAAGTRQTGPPMKEAHATSVPPAASDAATHAATDGGDPPRARSAAAAPPGRPIPHPRPGPGRDELDSQSPAQERGQARTAEAAARPSRNPQSPARIEARDGRPNSAWPGELIGVS